jgi:hypothetical protein
LFSTLYNSRFGDISASIFRAYKPSLKESCYWDVRIHIGYTGSANEWGLRTYKRAKMEVKEKI